MSDRGRCLLAALFTIALPSAAQSSPPPALSAADRKAASDRPVAVSIPQRRLGTSVEIGRVAVDGYGGGLVGMIVISAMDDKRDVMTANANAQATSVVAPLADALSATDVADLALQTTRRAMALTAGFDASATVLVPSPDAPTDAALLARHRVEQLGKVTYRYQMSPDFTQLQVVADVSVARAPALAPIYAQRVVSVVELRQRSYVHKENVDRWLGDDARVARQALAAAFTRLEQVIPAVIALDPAGFALKTDSRKTGRSFAAGFYGPTLMRDALGVVIWSKRNGFIVVQAAND